MSNTVRFEEQLKELVTGMKPGEWKQVYRNDLGMAMYVTPCVDCGNPVKNWAKKTDKSFKCKECRKKEKEQSRELTKQISELTLLRRLEKSEQYITKQYGNFIGYEHALKVVNENLSKPGWFQSTNEILAALELIRSSVKARHQVKMGRWHIDFVLPDYNAILEIDGGFHKEKMRKEKDKLKDAAIIAHLGPEWEIVRIRDEMLKSNLKKLVPAIKGLLTTRRKVRKSHEGLLPRNFSDTAI